MGDNTSPTLMPSGEVFMVADRMILVDRFESIAAQMFSLGQEGDQVAVCVTFTGKVNKSREREAVTVALPPEDALALVDNLMQALEVIVRSRSSEDAGK